MKGHIRKRGENVWCYVIDLPRDPVTGKRKQKWLTFHGPKKAAEKHFAMVLGDVVQDRYVPPADITVAEFFERFFRDYAESRVNPHTLADYRHLVRMYVLPKLGALRLDALRPAGIQQVYGELLKAGGKNGRPLSNTTVRHVHGVLRVAFRQAVNWQMIPKSPLEGVTPPAKGSKETEILEDAAIAEKLLEAATGTWLYIPVLLGVGAALRRGEVLALRWTDIDFTAGTLTVRAGILESGAKIWEAKPKTNESASTIELPKFVLAALKQHRSDQAQAYLAGGHTAPKDRLVVAHDDGSYRKPDNLTHAFGKLADRAGCPQVTFHGLRHTCGTYLLEQGVPVHVVSSVMRHTDEATTLRAYAHVLRRMKERSATVMDGFFPGAEKSEQWKQTFPKR